MKIYEERKCLVQSLEELPEHGQIENLYLDFETTSGDDKIDSLNPWKNCEVLGAAFTWDDHPNSYYVPMRQRNILDVDANLPIESCNEYLRNLVKASKYWINHHVKYDAHVGTNSADIDCSHIKFKDTLVLAKLVDSDRFRYGLTHMVHDYLYKDVKHYEQAFRPYLFHPGGSRKCSDYGVIPLTYMVPYACEDALDVRELYPELLNNLHESCLSVWETEQQVTRVLYEMEQKGLEVNIPLLAKDFVEIKTRLSAIKFEIRDLTGFMIEPNTNAHCYDLFHGHYGLPVLEETEKGDPSYNKDALKGLMSIPHAPHEVIKLVQEFRDKFKLFTGFTIPYVDKCTKTNPAKLHCSFNQCVRTGRMSCSEPNMQQLPDEAKAYVVPGEGRVFIDFDLKQIEYRFIAHYTKNARILEQYRNNSKADFHDTMAEMCDVDRDPAKTMNFGVSFGAGQAKTIMMLKSAFDLSKVPKGTNLDEYCQSRGKEVYTTYHKEFPELKQTQWKASNTLRQLGFIRNLSGRVRKLPVKLHYRSFNAAVQSGAADLMKEMTVRLYERTNNTSAHLLCIVHDSWLFSVPAEEEEYWKEELTKTIEETETKLSVPVYCSNKSSSKDWRECE